MSGGFQAVSALAGPAGCWLLHWLLHEGVGLAPGFALEADHPSVVDGAVDDRGGHVGVAEDPAPSAELDVGGVDDALGLVRVGDDLEQEPAAVLVDGHVAEFVDDEQRGPADRGEFPVEPVVRLGPEEPHDQARGGEVACGYALAACVPAERDGEVGLAGAGRAEQDEVGEAGDEVEGRDLPAPVVDGEADRGPVVAAELLVGGESGGLEQA